MKFIREIPKEKLTPLQINNLEQFGFTLIDKPGSIEVWVEGVSA